MAKGSVRKKGNKWYYRFYVEDESGRRVQREFAGTQSKKETEALLRKAIEDYETMQFVASCEQLTLQDLLEEWVEEQVKTGSLRNSTAAVYEYTARRIDRHPISARKIRTLTPDHLQAYINSLAAGGTNGKPLSPSGLKVYRAVLNDALQFAVFPKRYLPYNPMQYVKVHTRQSDSDLFCQLDTQTAPTITYTQFQQLTEYLTETNSPALLPVQIGYYAGLRCGEISGLTWQDIDLDDQVLAVRRSVNYNRGRHQFEAGPTKSGKVRYVAIGDTLTEILRSARQQQIREKAEYDELYNLNYCHSIQLDGRIYNDLYTLNCTESAPKGYMVLEPVCIHSDGRLITTERIRWEVKKLKKCLAGMEDFHFHILRHTYTSNLMAKGASVKEVQALLGHASPSITLNVYAHADESAKRAAAHLLDTLE